MDKDIKTQLSSIEDTDEVQSAVEQNRPHRLRRRLIFIAVLVAVLGGLSVITYPRIATNTNGVLYPYIYGYTWLADDSLDALIVGDSSSQCAIAPQVMNEITGISAYNSSSPYQSMATSAELTTEVFSTQSPKVIILEVNNLFKDTSTDKAVETLAGQLLPVLRYHNNWKKIVSGTMESGGPELTADLGYYPKYEVNAYTGGDYMAATTSGASLSFWAKTYLEWMQQVCAEHGATLVLISVPNASEWNDAKHDAVADYANENGITYLDFNTSEYDTGFDWSTDTRDGGGHLNISGATKISTWLARWLAENEGIGTISDTQSS